MKRKEEGKRILKIVCAGHDEERQNKEQVLLSLYPR
jgi:hypothetical protein